ncbi:MAG: hypothetical protein A2X50_08835 [Candidatus Rokubacteria bacterium GWF2_70_14]|nr:MAG: hypothetical protein A2X50_08835 [Candidatus Rokubacteria bacterium GWF2_70_14]
MTDPDLRPLAARADLVAGAALLLVALGAFVTGGRLSWGTITQPGPGFFPRALAVLLAVLSLALLTRGLRHPGADLREQWADGAGRRRVLLMTATLLGYVLLVGTAGYLLTTAALFVVMVRWVGGRGWTATLLTGAIGSAGSYLLFGRLLRVELPAGLWVP